MKHQNANNLVARTIYVRVKLHSLYIHPRQTLEVDFKFDFLSLLASGKKSIIRSSERFPFGRVDDFSFHVAINLSRCKAVLSCENWNYTFLNKRQILSIDCWFFALIIGSLGSRHKRQGKNGILSYHRRSIVLSMSLPIVWLLKLFQTL